MTSFHFPPPPPPPPKASPSSSNDASDHLSSQTGRNRGARGRGWDGRGRGSNRGGGSGSGHNDTRSRGHAQSRGNHGNRRGDHQNRRDHVQQHNSQAGMTSQTRTSPISTTPGLLPSLSSTPSIPYVNPLLVNQMHSGSQLQKQTNEVLMAQAATSMSTAVGMQAMNALAHHMTNNRVIKPFALHSPSGPQPQNDKKRKLSGRSNIPSPYNVAQTSTQQHKPQKAKVTPAPAVPNFGFTLPPIPGAQGPSSPKPDAKSDQKKRKVNLGLSAKGKEVPEVGDEAIHDNDDDEEATLASSMEIKAAVFEHEGLQMSLQTVAEIKAWLEDRRKNFPTKKRVEEKARREAEQRAKDLQLLKKIRGDVVDNKKTTRQQDLRPEVQVRRLSNENHQQKLEQSRVKAQESSTARKAAVIESDHFRPTTEPAVVNLLAGYDSRSESEGDASSVLSDSSVVSSSEHSSDGSQPDSDDGNAAPEEQSSKIAIPPKVQPLPSLGRRPPVARRQKDFPVHTCRDWERNGKCKMGKRCKFDHPSKDDPKRLSLYEAMVEKELVEQDRQTLKAIKWLGQNGYLG